MDAITKFVSDCYGSMTDYGGYNSPQLRRTGLCGASQRVLKRAIEPPLYSLSATGSSAVLSVELLKMAGTSAGAAKVALIAGSGLSIGVATTCCTCASVTIYNLAKTPCTSNTPAAQPVAVALAAQPVVVAPAAQAVPIQINQPQLRNLFTRNESSQTVMTEVSLQ
ncbi:MAG: hypothetical protein O3A01_03660 [bacterium]|nr:hypothetical protein [bacterium]